MCPASPDMLPPPTPDTPPPPTPDTPPPPTPDTPTPAATENEGPILVPYDDGSGKRNPRVDVRNFGIMAHIDAGKTTVTERILLYSGRIHRTGEVHDGQATMDYLKEERERGITITSAATHTSWRGCRLNIIDTPGHVDFTAEVERSLRVLDGCVAVFDAQAGVEPQSETVWRQADRYQVPRICFLNKMDKPGADFDASIASIRTRLGAPAIAVQYPIGEGPDFSGIVDLLERTAYVYDEASQGRRVEQGPIPEALVEKVDRLRLELVEAVAEIDDVLLERYLGGEELHRDDLLVALRKGVVEGTIVPVLCGSALRNKGVQRLLDAVCYYMPSPLDVPFVEATSAATGETVRRKPDPSEPLTALSFKTVADKNGDLNFVRVYSGVLEQGAQVWNPVRRKKERVSRLMVMHANERQLVERLDAGHIGAVVGFKDTRTGDTICTREEPVLLEAMTFPETVISMSIEPASRGDRDKLGEALSRLSREDPTFRAHTDEETGETIISGMGELHLDVLCSRLLTEHRVQCKTGKPKVAYRQTIAKEVDVEGRHVKQTGGHGQFGVVKVRFAPGDETENIFESRIVGGSVPREYIPAVERGLHESAERGDPLGFPFVRLHFELYDGKAHDVDSSEIAFREAGRLAFRNAVSKVGTRLLEPWMRIVVTSPEDNMGDVLGSLNQRRGQVEQTEKGTGDVIRVYGAAPLAEMFRYSETLRGLTQGRGIYTMEPLEYRPVPESIAEEIRKEVLAAKQKR